MMAMHPRWQATPETDGRVVGIYGPQREPPILALVEHVRRPTMTTDASLHDAPHRRSRCSNEHRNPPTLMRDPDLRWNNGQFIIGGLYEKHPPQMTRG